MGENRVKCKMGSLLIIIALVFSGVLIIIPSTPMIMSAESASAWTETSDTDFKKGTLDNVTILGTGSTAELTLKANFTGNWLEKPKGSIPSPRRGHVMSTIFGTSEVLLFGGWDGGYLGDTWTYNLSNNKWTEMKPSSKPGGRHSHAMVSIYGDDKVVLFGGYKSSSAANNETWVYDLSDNNWTQKSPSTKPATRAYHDLASVYNDDQVVLFGGYNLNKDTYLNDTWVYDLNLDKWTKKSPSTAPSARKGHEMANVYKTKEIVLFGGNVSGIDVINDTWVYNLSKDQWTNKNPLGNKPTARRGHGMAAIHGTKKVMIFGSDDQTWIYDLSTNTWTKKSPSTKPSARYITHGIASVHGANKAVLFGGGSSGGDLDDTWVYEASKYIKNGTYVSSSYDTGAHSSFKTLSWTADTYAGASIKFQLRTAVTKSGLSSNNFVGPNGKATKYYTSSPSNIWSGHNGSRWIQYIAYFKTNNEDVTPSLNNVKISYNNLPKTTLFSPMNEVITSDNQPTFEWAFNDPDDGEQMGFQVLIDDDRAFENVMFDSGKQNSSNQYWDCLESIPDGVWFWMVRTKDNDGDWSDFSASWMITIDTKAPSSEITIPNNNGFYNRLNTISGMAIDSIDGSGIDIVEISIKQFNKNKYWDGNGWNSNEHWLPTIGINPWSYDSSDVQWSSDTQYTIRSRAIDVAGNLEIIEVGTTIMFDDQLPVNLIISINDGESYANSFAVLLSLNSEDFGTGVSQMAFSTDGKSWTDWEQFDTTKYFDLPEGDGEKNIYFKVQDHCGNTAEPVTDSIILDTTPPKDLSIVINNDDEFTNLEIVTLSLDAIDHLSGINDMSFSIDGIIWTNWEEFNSRKSMTIPSEDGELTIYFRVRDSAGNIAAASDTIIMDTTKPDTLSLSINNGAAQTNSTTVELQLNALDDTSGVYQMAFSSDGGFWYDWENFANIKAYLLSTGDGEKVVYLKVKDKAGNIAYSTPVTIELDTSPPVIDTDGDGYEDEIDAFPDDPAASVDSDGDEYPDYWNYGRTEKDSVTGLHLDAYPNDPNRHTKNDDVNDSISGILSMAFALILVSIIIISLVTSIVVRNKRQRLGEPYSNNTYLQKMRHEILHGKSSSNSDLTDDEIQNKLEDKYQHNEISESTYQYIKNKNDEVP